MERASTADILDQFVEFKPFMSEVTVKLSPRTVKQFLCKPTKSGAMCSDEQALRFCMLCRARGLNPWEGDAYIVGYDTQDGPEFNLITAHQAFLKRAETHPEYDGMQSGVVVRTASGAITEVEGDLVEDGQTLLGGWARVHFKTRKIPMFKRLKLGTFSTGRSRWAKDPAGMIVKCAEADALRSAFPNKLGGMYLDDEFHDASTITVAAGPLPRGNLDLRAPKAIQTSTVIGEAAGNGAGQPTDNGNTQTETANSQPAAAGPTAQNPPADRQAGVENPDADPPGNGGSLYADGNQMK